MNRTTIAACALALALTTTTSASAFGANYGGWAVKALGQTYGNSLVVPAASKQRHMSGQKFKRGHTSKRGNRHTFRRGQKFKRGHTSRRGNRHTFRRGHRLRRGRHSFALEFPYYYPYYYPYYGYRRYRPYDYPYAPLPAYAQPAPSYAQPAEPTPTAQPAEPAPALTPEQEAYCREIIIEDVVIGGVEQQAYGTACREPDGSWKIKNLKPKPASRGGVDDSAREFERPEGIGIELRGIVIIPGRSLAMLERRNSKTVIRASEGQKVGDWTIERILSDRVVLSRGEARQELKLAKEIQREHRR